MNKAIVEINPLILKPKFVAWFLSLSSLQDEFFTLKEFTQTLLSKLHLGYPKSKSIILFRKRGVYRL